MKGVGIMFESPERTSLKSGDRISINFRDQTMSICDQQLNRCLLTIGCHPDHKMMVGALDFKEAEMLAQVIALTHGFFIKTLRKEETFVVFELF